MSEYSIFDFLHVSVKRGEWAEYGSVFGIGAIANSVGERADFFAAGADQLIRVALLQISIDLGDER